MSATSTKMNCYLLAGGKSSRMGEDKGLMMLHDKRIIEHILAILKPIFKKIIIVSNNKSYSQFGAEVIPDLILDCGPAGAIYTALVHSDSEQIFVVTCDMPFISAEAIAYLISESKNVQIVVPVHHQKFEPLFALYSRSCLETWKKVVDTGVFKLQNIISNFKVLELNVEGHSFFPEDLFTNINTKEDLEKASKKMNYDN